MIPGRRSAEAPVFRSARPGGVAVSARDWGFRYAGRAGAALEGLTIDIPAGQRVLLAGASGSGKSTFLAALAGVIGGDEDGEQTGLLRIGDEKGGARSGSEVTVGLVLQDPESQSVLPRIGDDVAFGCENLGVPRDEIWRRVGESLELVGLSLPWDTPTSSLSGGQKQRLALAGVLAMHPRLLLLDEPTANVDPAGREQVLRAVESAVEATGATLIVVEHRLDLWLRAVDRLIVLDAGGEVRADGEPSEVVDSRADTLAAAGVWLPQSFQAEAPQMGRGVSRQPAVDARPLLAMRRLAVAPAPRAPTVARVSDLTVYEGRALAVTGPNGAGKTTLALTLGGLLPPSSGTVEASRSLAGGLAPDPYRWRSRQLAARIGTVFQQPERQFLAATVRGELLVGPSVARRRDREAGAIADALLERLDLAHLAQANPYTLSGGQKRRLSVAAVLAAAPPLVILDEPTFGQDRHTWLDLVALLGETLDDGHGIVFVSHDERLVEEFASDRLPLTAAPANHDGPAGRRRPARRRKFTVREGR
jgi:energy-coupling factor transport system ATP-binding protein